MIEIVLTDEEMQLGEAAGRIRERWGYLQRRPDLRAHPHGDLQPQAVRVRLDLVPV